ncbi:hypothetical protein [Sphingomonas bacterium]|uniref:hypothetical protein n=1 Tax=Sphingomonas bacterium TaxID=1895847 RepID=UPI002610E783|nr:hypothetical protein [Sphingomonas bacterium]MDB5677770.1 hypothetical protein [Sphingomonas bacterium]
MRLRRFAIDRTFPAAESVVLKSIRPDATRIVFPGVGHEVIFTALAKRRIAGWLQEQAL